MSSEPLLLLLAHLPKPLFELLAADDPGVAQVIILSERPSLEMTKPDGSMGMAEESSPLVAMVRAGMSMGAYINIDPNESMQLS